MKSEPLSKVAPSKSSDRRISADSIVWHLNLDQIVSGSGTIDDRIYAPLKEAGASTFVFDERNVLYSKLRPYLNKVVCPDSLGVATTELVPLRPDPKILDRSYLCYYLRSLAFVSWVSSQVAGAKMPRVNMKSFWTHEIPLPPLEDQIRIAHLLSKVEGLIAQRKQHLQQLDDLLKSVFLNMFGILDGTYKNWPIEDLEQHAGISSGVTKGKKYGDQQLLEVPYVRVANVQDGYFDLNEIKTIFVSETESRQCQLKRGDLLLTEGGDRDKLGRGSVWDEQIPYCIHQNHIFRVRINENSPLIPRYLSALVGSIYGKAYFLKSAKQTTGIASINSSQLKKFPVLVAPTQLQERYCNISKAIIELRSRYCDSLVEAERLYNRMSQQSFKGDLDLSRVIPPRDSAIPNADANIEPITYPTEDIPFKLSEPTAYPLDNSARVNQQTLNAWLTEYLAHIRLESFSSDDFLNLVEGKLTDMTVDRDAEWIPARVDASAYDYVKQWLFDRLESNQLYQKYDDKKNRVRVSQGKD